MVFSIVSRGPLSGSPRNRSAMNLGLSETPKRVRSAKYGLYTAYTLD